MTDFLLQKSPDRGRIYHQPPGIWYSPELRRWMVTAPALVREAMYNPAFAVPTYDVSAITSRLKIDVAFLDELRGWFPLAYEGERHGVLREKFARHIAGHTRASVEFLGAELERQAKHILSVPAGETICLYQSLLRPAMMASLLRLADLDLPAEWPFEDLPLLFDVRLSTRKRRELNELVGRIVAAQPFGRSIDDRYFRAAILTLSVNTLIGSLGLTIADEVGSNPGRRLAEIAWPQDLIRTGLPSIEKFAVSDAALGGQFIRAGQGIRLFLESAGVDAGGQHSFDDVFFAVGSHKCLGISFSKLVWQKFRNFLAGIDRSISILEVRDRSHDYVFNFPQLIRVRFDD